MTKKCALASLTTILLLVHAVISVRENEQENNDCPKMCTCHMSHFSQLSFASLVYKNQGSNSFAINKRSYKAQNEVLEEDEEIEFSNNPVLKTAMCVISEQNKTKDFLTNLQITEALTLLQNNRENVSLTPDYFQEFINLQILEIHGTKQQKHNVISPKVRFGDLILKHNTLQVIKSLEYINIQNIKLSGSLEKSNKILSTGYQTIHIDTNKKIQSQSDLIFLAPNDTDVNILPYSVYKEEHYIEGIYSFSGLKKLKFLRIYECGLREVSWETFDGLHNLETLLLEGNELLFIPEFSFYKTPRLKSLSLGNNKLLNIQSWSFAGLLQLQRIDISNNNISHLSELSFPPFPQLISADLSNNPLEVVFPNTFEIMNGTKQMTLGSTDAKLIILPNTFSGLIYLLTLKLINIDQDVLDRYLLKGMPRLEKLEITGRIRSISFDAFLNMPKVKQIIMKNCSIEKLSMDSFYGLNNLELLDLSDNLLTHLPPGLFDQHLSLKELYLQNNNLTTLPKGLLTGFPAAIIRLDGNPWHCTCAMMEWKPSVINKVKQISTDKSLCRSKYDKGICHDNRYEYIYSNKVEPLCETPAKYKGWSVFHLLRKKLHCKTKLKHESINQKAYLIKKLEEYANKREYKKHLHNLKKHDNKETNDTLENSLKTYQFQQVNNKVEISLNKDFSKVLNSTVQTTTTPNRQDRSNTSNEYEYNNTNNNNNPSETRNSLRIQNLLIDKEVINHLQPDIQRTEDKVAKLYYTRFMNNSDEINNLNHSNHFVKEQKLSKKEKEKLRLLKEKEERHLLKEKLKLSDITLKKTWKTEMEQRQKEKLKHAFSK